MLRQTSLLVSLVLLWIGSPGHPRSQTSQGRPKKYPTGLS